jgi:hypothetical protein
MYAVLLPRFFPSSGSTRQEIAAASYKKRTRHCPFEVCAEDEASKENRSPSQLAASKKQRRISPTSYVLVMIDGPLSTVLHVRHANAQ